MSKSTPMSQSQWSRLPRELRIKWWVTTQFDRLPPTEDLLREVAAALQGKGNGRSE